jgi:peptide/nickel transport system ATP-binding protein
MDLIVELTKQRGMSTILITHDLGLAATYCDRVAVMEKGHVVESALSRNIFTAPSHAYTRKLMRATPRPGASLRDLLPEDDPAAAGAAGSPLSTGAGADRVRGSNGDGAAAKAGAPLLVVEKLVKEYPRKGMAGSFKNIFQRKPAPEPEMFRAVDGISFAVNRGESVGLVGESGCGKSTTSTMVMRLIDKTDGVIMFDGEDIGAIPAKKFARLPMRKRIQMVFQDPTDSLNPRFTAARAIADPILRLGEVKGGDAVRARCEALARQVGLPVELLDRFPHQLSGGQKARVGIAAADRARSRSRHLDEPTAALDVSVQAVVLNLLQELKDSLGMSYLFVSHDLNVVRLLCDRVIVMNAGRIVEQVRPSRCWSRPKRNTPATSSRRSPIRRLRDGGQGRWISPQSLGSNDEASQIAEGQNKDAGCPREQDRARQIHAHQKRAREDHPCKVRARRQHVGVARAARSFHRRCRACARAPGRAGVEARDQGQPRGYAAAGGFVRGFPAAGRLPSQRRSSWPSYTSVKSAPP